MRRSKLEKGLSILETLASNGPLKITHVMHKANVNFNVMKKYFDLLIKLGAIEKEAVSEDKIVYKISKRGLYLVNCFYELKKIEYDSEISKTCNLRNSIFSGVKNQENIELNKRANKLIETLKDKNQDEQFCD